MNKEDLILKKLDQIADDVSVLKTDVAELKTDVAELKTRVTKVEVTQEQVILPRLELLAEGHVELKEQIRRLSVIDAMQDDIATLKSAVRFLSEKINKLENAG